MANGSCLCGTVKFEVSGEFSSMSHCHCSMCRKVHGALFATFFHADKVEYTTGKQAIDTYESSPGFIRSFCNDCGSPLPEKAVDGSEGYYVPAGLMDEDPGVRPDKHIFVESKADWHNITDTLPQHKHYGDGDETRVVDIAEAVAKEGVVTGGCQCGDVSFEFSGSPKFMMNCHCSRCQKVRGAAHATNAFVECDKLTWLSGGPIDETSAELNAEKGAEKGAEISGESKVTNFALPGAKFFGNAFCNQCGSSVPRARADGSVYNVPVGTLDQSPGIEAKGHIFVGSKASWFKPTDELPKWDEMPN